MTGTSQLCLPDAYRGRFDAMLADVAAKGGLNDEKLTVFWPMCGRRFVLGKGLMVIGRAVNGWTEGGWTPEAFGDPGNRGAAIDEVRTKAETYPRCPMSWVGESAGAQDGYNTNKSPFWRIIREITKTIVPESSDDDWWSHICWSNLYKVSPWEGGNPLDRLCSAQFDSCVKLLQDELGFYRPRRVLVITGEAWYRDFVSNLGIDASYKPRATLMVEGIARHPDQHWVFTNRPEGRPDNDSVREVLEAFEECAGKAQPKRLLTSNAAGSGCTMKNQKIASLVDQLQAQETSLHQKDFLLTWEQSAADLRAVLLAAEVLEETWRANVSARVFDAGLAVSNFRDKSTRTRFSFASAASLLGLSLQELDETKSQIAHGETVRETANMISFLTEVIGVRDDLFLGEGHKYMAEVAAAVEDGYREGVLPQRPAVINLQCDQDHPTQSLSDLLHLQKTFGSLEALRGKKLAMTWAYSPSYGKPLSVAQGIIGLMTRFGVNVILAHPEGYDVIPELERMAGQHAAESGGSFTKVHSLEEAFAEADIVYPKSWAPYHVMERRTALLRAGDARKLDDLEKECLADNAKHKHWECTEKLMKLTKGGRAIYMHPLPADITDVSCPAGEVAATVFERYRLDTYREAQHKPYVIAAMILLTRCERPARVLADLWDKPRPHRRGT